MSLSSSKDGEEKKHPSFPPKIAVLFVWLQICGLANA